MGKNKSVDGDASALATSIIDTIKSSNNGKSMELKELRTAVSDGASDDKSSKKLFKQAVKLLEKDEKVKLNADGIVKLSKSERSKVSKSIADGDDEPKSEKKKKKEKKRKRESKEDGAEFDDDVEENTKKQKQVNAEESEDDEEENATTVDDESKNDNNNETAAEDSNNNDTADPKDKNKPCKGNPQGVTRLFLGNLPFAITEPTLSAHLLDCVTHIKWITDKETGKFYGSAFCEVRNSKDAAKCLGKLNGSNLMGRPMKINYAPVRSGEEGDWPPRSRVITGGKVANAGGGQAGGSGIKAMSEKPEGCAKLFLGNLSYDIDDEGITKFFMGVEAEIKSVRWLHHKDSGDFKGCGYADFWNAEACEKAASLNGKNLLGRPIRIDWAE
mmetsp:Transcript_1927/g.3690  ORF Transcript_1927/g.3690 Transcript_1927/m.3690 type:complete len:387 (+) Transcript_1927:105-1265(+)